MEWRPEMCVCVCGGEAWRRGGPEILYMYTVQVYNMYTVQVQYRVFISGSVCVLLKSTTNNSLKHSHPIILRSRVRISDTFFFALASHSSIESEGFGHFCNFTAR